jgi:hypothetical protein
MGASNLTVRLPGFLMLDVLAREGQRHTWSFLVRISSSDVRGKSLDVKKAKELSTDVTTYIL